jgi:hypothetical protein
MDDEEIKAECRRLVNYYKFGNDFDFGLYELALACADIRKPKKNKEAICIDNSERGGPFICGFKERDHPLDWPHKFKAGK